MPDDLYVPLSSTYYDYETPPVAFESFTSTHASGGGTDCAFPISKTARRSFPVAGVIPQLVPLRP